MLRLIRLNLLKTFPMGPAAAKMLGMSLAEPRQHHRLPTFYLAGFTASGRPDDQLYVWDFVKRKNWRARPNKVGKQRDYYRIDVAGVDPNYVEKVHNSLENKTSPIVERVRRTRELPTGRDLDYLILFVALLDARGEDARERFRTAHRKAARDLLLEYLGDPETLHAYVEWLTEGKARLD